MSDLVSEWEDNCSALVIGDVDNCFYFLIFVSFPEVVLIRLYGSSMARHPLQGKLHRYVVAYAWSWR